MTAPAAFDLLLMSAVVLVAVRAIHAPRLFTGVVLYIAFGLLLSLVWVRLGAPDLALTEAAIGAGITGALLLDAAGQLGEGTGREGRGAAQRWAAALGCASLFLLLAAVSLSLEGGAPSLGPTVLDQMEQSGVTNPVTAVLLNFRAYDTWLEIAVLLAAAVAVLALRGRGSPLAALAPESSDPVVRTSIATLVPLALVIAGYLLWRGTDGPGGAFQAGAVAGAAAILLFMLGWSPPQTVLDRWTRPVLTSGFLLFGGIGVFGVAARGAFLGYPPAAAGTLILVIEAALTLSIAATLALLFAAAQEPDAGREERP